ncbi:hypothetical protein [Stenotrophomonas sp. MMGLT7]|uniref:hypothetical protein n=1 Tax=Stenotrophomonas sp. MMGLT7 TaxID=2901227 RepID=UPI001E65AF14|nr:hypothetical protein [Stenotrophomonas sp. MMGLT7]MCD7099979.1 hypothetical protein [Stenotrophomonas sp. MMGLT7]
MKLYAESAVRVLPVAVRKLRFNDGSDGPAPATNDEVEAAMTQLETALWLLLAESLDEATFWRRFSRMLDACVVTLPAEGAERVYRHADFLLARAGLPAWAVAQQRMGR